jgi:hypothetical protein
MCEISLSHHAVSLVYYFHYYYYYYYYNYLLFKCVCANRSFQRLASYCHGVLFKLCSSWTLHGRLLDPFHEFFVVRGNTTTTSGGGGGGGINNNKENESESALLTGGGGGRSLAWDSWASSEWDMAPWNFSHVMSGSSSMKYGGGGGGRRNGGGVAEEDWNKAFILRIDAIPLSLLPTSVAQQVNIIYINMHC